MKLPVEPDGRVATIARHVVELADSGEADFQPLYGDELSLWDKVEAIATRLYGASGITMDDRIRDRFHELQSAGFSHLPICMAKTPQSLSANPKLIGAPTDFTVPIRQVRLAAGAGFLVVLAGKVLTMPGLPPHPAAWDIAVNDLGDSEGLR